MPCQDFGQVEEDARNEYIKKTALEEEVNKLEAMLCAIVNELRYRDDDDIVIRIAERKGNVSIRPWIKKHSECDDERLMKSLVDQFSTQELHKIKMILNKQQ